MGVTLFFDLKDQPMLYMFEKSRGTYIKKEALPVTVSAEYELGLEKAPHDIEASYVSVPLSMLSFRTIELPFSDMKRVREVLPFELDNLILGGAGGIVFDARVLKESEGTYKFLVVCIKKDSLGKLLEAFRRQGLDIKTVTSIDLVSALDAFSSADEIAGLLMQQSTGSLRAEDRITIAAHEVADPAIDLRRGEFAYSGDTEKARKSLKYTLVFSALLLVLFLSDLSLNSIAMKKESLSIHNEIRRSYTDMFPGERNITSEIYQLKAHLREMKDKEPLFAGISPLQVLLDVTAAGKNGFSFNEIDIENARIVLKGECRTLSDVQTLRNSLAGFFTDVAISDTKPLVQGKTAFTISAKVRRT
jgi:type II secretory pathway component PulL